jgi:hypothetical protein
MGILANNEWREGWLDEGFTSFQSSWFAETHGQDPDSVWARDLRNVRAVDGSGRSEPIGLRSADFSTFPMYNMMTYTKPSLVYRMLRDLIGEDLFRRGLHLYYDRNELRHVREADFRAAMEEISGRDLGWFFQQWIHSTATLDYSIGAVRTRARSDGLWETTVEVNRAGEAWMPVRLQVGNDVRMLESRARSQTETFLTSTRPTEAVVDPGDVLIDLNPDNNRKAIGP